MTDRYPPVEPYSTGFLEVTDGNVLYWECAGNPGGLPAVFLHGGPGGGSWPGSDLVLLDDAGHGGGTFHEQVTCALDGYRDRR